MIQRCLFVCIGWIYQTCNARYRWRAGIYQYLTLMPPVLILVSNACSYQVCMCSVVVIQFPGKEKVIPLNTMVSIVWKLPRFSYYIWCWYHSHRVDECSNAFLFALYSQQPQTSMESARYNIQRRSEILKWWLYLQHLWIFCNAYLEQPIYITYFGWEIKDEFSIPVIAECDSVPPELLDVIQCQAKSVLQRHVDASGSICQARHSAIVMVYRIAWIHSLQSGKLPNHLKRRLKQITLTPNFQMILMMVFHILVLQKYWVLTESRIPLKPVLGGVKIVALYISPLIL